MTEWKKYTIQDFAEIQNSRRIPLSKMEREKRKGNMPYYGASGIIDYVDDYLFEGEHVLVSEDGENLKSRKTPIAFKADGKFWVNNHAHILKGKRKEFNDLIVYYFSQLDINEFITGAVQPKLSKNSLLSIPLYLPDNKDTILLIVSVIKSIVDKIDLLHRQNQTLEQMAETLFRKWFVEDASEEWEGGVLGDLVEFNYGKALKQSERSGSGFPVYGSSGIVGYHNEYIVNGPGIITGRKGTLGIINYCFSNFFPIDTTFYITSKRGSKGLYFEYLLLKVMNLVEMNTDSAVPGLNRNMAHGIEILIPPNELIVKFNTQAEPFFTRILLIHKQLNTLERLRDNLLPKLMNGEIKIKPNE